MPGLNGHRLGWALVAANALSGLTLALLLTRKES